MILKYLLWHLNILSSIEITNLVLANIVQLLANTVQLSVNTAQLLTNWTVLIVVV